MYPQIKKTCGHADIKLNIMQVWEDTSVLLFTILYFVCKYQQLHCKTPLLLDTLLIKFVKLAAGRWFSLLTPPIKQDNHDIAEILLKVALNTITL
jgi:hypothetical protein